MLVSIWYFWLFDWIKLNCMKDFWSLILGDLDLYSSFFIKSLWDIESVLNILSF